MRRGVRPCLWIVALLSAVVSPACGDGEDSGDVSASSGASAEVSSRSGEGGDLDPCRLLGGGLLSGAVGVDETVIEFDPGGGAHPYCEATWRQANADRLQAEHDRQMEQWLERRMEASRQGKPFDETMPRLRTENKVMLTVAGAQFPDDAAAVSALESVVERLGKGVTAEAGGTEAVFQSDYGEWIEGLGDRAAWNGRMSQVSVAARGTLFHLSVRVADEEAENRKLALELARAVSARL